MTKKHVIEDLRGSGMTARVTDTGKLFSTYKDFARDAGYPDAAAISWAGDEKVRGLDDRIGEEFDVLARGEHVNRTFNGIIVYVIESEDGERFLVGEDGLDIKEPEHVSDLTEMDRHELTELIKKATDELLARSFVDGFETGVDHADWIELMEKSPQEQRDSIIKRAKDDIKKLIPDGPQYEGMYYEAGEWLCNVEFVVNKGNRTVVALMKGMATGKIRSRGIAKCAPTDCFNVHIGKAIALRRAIDEEVPDEYLNAPQPTEVRVGDIVNLNGATEMEVFQPAIKTVQRRINSGVDKIIDDSRDE